jgi:hypothetical protein
MSLLLWTLAFYGLGATAVLLLSRYRAARERALLQHLLSISLDTLQPLEQLEGLAKRAEILSKQIPWYERSLSTIGVIAFFSMLIATGLQTTNANLSDAKIQRLQDQLKALEGQQASLAPAVARAARATIDQYQGGHVLEDGAEEVLRLRLDTLQRSSADGEEAIAEMLDIALVLRDLHQAVSLIEEHPEFVETAKPYHLASVAECYFISGSKAHASETLKRLEDGISNLNRNQRLRVLVLKAALTGNIEPQVEKVAVLLRTTSSKGRDRLRRDVQRLQRSAQDFDRQRDMATE